MGFQISLQNILEIATTAFKTAAKWHVSRVQSYGDVSRLTALHRLTGTLNAISTNLWQDWTVVALLSDITWKLPTTTQRSAYCLQKPQKDMWVKKNWTIPKIKVGSISAVLLSPVCLVPVLLSLRPSRSIDFGDSNHVNRKRLTEAKYRGLGTRQRPFLKRVEERGLLSRTAAGKRA